ncbi:hypothetical protein [Comamonas resistens]|uniref:hypothetical protein n=1 Tax=Comamonas resistens TaxID=3046670 RepID=UPI0039BCBDBF
MSIGNGYDIGVRSITFYESFDVDGHGIGTPAASLTLTNGVLTLQTRADLRLVVQGGMQLHVQHGVGVQIEKDCATTIDGNQTTHVAGVQSTITNDYLLQAKGHADTRVKGDAMIVVDGNSAHQTSGLHRTEAAQIERHATEHLKDDAGGVGHTYMPDQVHMWMPWHGAGDCPQPPEHPLTASNRWCWPDGEGSDAAPESEGAADGH